MINENDGDFFFQLGGLNVKDEMINNDTSVGQRKKSESPTGIDPMASATPGGGSIH